MPRKKVNNETKILNVLNNKLGKHFCQIERETGITDNLLHWELFFLEDSGLIEKRKIQKGVVLYRKKN